MKSFKEFKEAMSLPTKLSRKLERVYRKFEKTTKSKMSLRENGVDLKPFGNKDYTNGTMTLVVDGVDKNNSVDKQELNKLAKVVERAFKVKLKNIYYYTETMTPRVPVAKLSFTGLNTQSHH